MSPSPSPVPRLRSHGRPGTSVAGLPEVSMMQTAAVRQTGPLAGAQVPLVAASIPMHPADGAGGYWRWEGGAGAGGLLDLGAGGGGDGEAFAALVGPYRRELQMHCYRILGSPADAEDALQDTLLSAWQGLAGYEGRASLRTWLYRVATSRCLDALRSASRHGPVSATMPDADPPEPTRLGAVLWREPHPDVFLEGLADSSPGPEARYQAREAISLAFVTALQLLPPRQRAVLILRDVLGFHAGEVAGILNTS